MNAIATFFSNLFAPDKRTSDGHPYMNVSVRMCPEVFCRFDRLTRFLDVAGDSLIHMALDDWLKANEKDIYEGRKILRRGSR